MALDKDTISVTSALRIAKRYYPKDTYDHAMRVMQIVADNEMIPHEYQHDCLVLAIMHDLVEDTEYKPTLLPEYLGGALKLLTKPKEMDYIEYIKKIRNTGYTNWRMCAWWVKLADMKDHLAQTETLTEKLRDKYLAALPYLL